MCIRDRGCTVRTSTKVRHYVPDAVVSSYSNTGENPWVEVQAMSTPNPSAQAVSYTHLQDSGAPTSRPAAPDRPQQIQSSSAVRPRTTTGWRLSRCGRKVTVPSARTCC